MRRDAAGTSPRRTRSGSAHRAKVAAIATTTTARALLLGLLVPLALGLPATAAAAETTPGNYRPSALQYAPGSPVANCRSWSGGADDAGHLYAACPGTTYPYVYEFAQDGTYLRFAQLPASYLYDQTYRMRDVVPSPDGSQLYVSTGPIVDDIGVHPERNGTAYAGAILRMVRQADGSWAWDRDFRAGPFVLGGHYWAARYLDVDAAGHLYAAVNAFVFEINPGTGAIISRFGGATTTGAGGRWVDGIDVAQGLAVAPDGASIFVVEQQHHILQRWVRVGATDWRRDRTWGPHGTGILGVPDDEDDANASRGLCATNDHFQSPYDVAVDLAGDIYVEDVSCRRIQRFDAAGAFLQTVWSNGPDGDLNHGFAINGRGDVLLPEQERLLSRVDPATPPAAPGNAGGTGAPGGAGGAPAGPGAAGAPAPCRDAAAPRIASVVLPTTTATRSVTVRVSATDDCSGVTHVRISGMVSTAPAWHAGLTQTVQLSGASGAKSLVVEVRDAAGRTASRTVATRLALPQGELRSRSLVRLAGSGCSPVAPASRIAHASMYRIVDRCARISGRIAAVRGAAVQLELTAAMSRAIYVNAVGATRIWIVLDRRTRRSGQIRVGRSAVALGTLVATRDLRSTSGIPIDALSAR